MAIPAHGHLLIDQGIQIGEFHKLEGLAVAYVNRFTYERTKKHVKALVAGFAMRYMGNRVDKVDCKSSR
jgi:hypothetical protein